MPLVTIDVVEGVFSADEKIAILSNVTEAMVAVEGEGLRPVTWVRINEVAQGDWAVGGQRLCAPTVHAMRGVAKQAA